jgi:hypothetical protein
VREADRRQGKQANMAHFFPALALAERAPRMGADGSLRLRAEGDSELDEPGRSLVEEAALVAGLRELLMGRMDVREGALDVLVDVGQILRRGLLPAGWEPESEDNQLQCEPVRAFSRMRPS